MIDACCLLCLCFTGSCCHYRVTAVLLPSLIPDLSSWFPVGGSCPATTSLLHHLCLCLHVHQSGDGGLSQHTNLSRVSPSRSFSCNHHCAYFSFFFVVSVSCDSNVIIKCELRDYIRGTSWVVSCILWRVTGVCHRPSAPNFLSEIQMKVEQEFQAELELYSLH